MKYLHYIFALVFFLTIPLSLFAQGQIGDGDDDPLQTQLRGTNMISCSAYEAIKYKGYTVAQIQGSEGGASEIQQLLGGYTSVERDNFLGTATYYYGSNKVSFREGVFRKLEINNTNWPLTVTGKTIKVGDSFSEMKQKFGNDLKIIYKPSIDPNYSVSFGCSGRDGDGLLIDFNTSTNKVVKIIYFLSP